MNKSIGPLYICTAERFRLLQPHFGHLSCIPVLAIAQQKHLGYFNHILGCLSWISVTKEYYQKVHWGAFSVPLDSLIWIIWLHSWHYYHNHNNNSLAVSQSSWQFGYGIIQNLTSYSGSAPECYHKGTCNCFKMPTLGHSLQSGSHCKQRRAEAVTLMCTHAQRRCMNTW